MLLIAAAGIFGAITTVMDDSAAFAAWIAVAFCGILIPAGIGLVVWYDRLEAAVTSYR
jgi:hypothetical protein